MEHGRARGVYVTGPDGHGSARNTLALSVMPFPVEVNATATGNGV